MGDKANGRPCPRRDDVSFLCSSSLNNTMGAEGARGIRRSLLPGLAWRCHPGPPCSPVFVLGPIIQTSPRKQLHKCSLWPRNFQMALQPTPSAAPGMSLSWAPELPEQPNTKQLLKLLESQVCESKHQPNRRLAVFLALPPSSWAQGSAGSP